MAWVFQDSRQRKKLGDAAPWCAGWLTAEGKRRSKKLGSKSKAEKYARKVEGQIAAGVYHDESRKKWTEFKLEYESRIANGMDPKTKQVTLDALKHFERLVFPGRVSTIKTSTIDTYVAKRRIERGKKRESTISVSSVNKELRCLKAVLRIAHDWGYLPVVPKIRMLREPRKIPRYVTPEDFAKLYGACEHATRPTSDVYATADWWRALLVFAYLSGWRIGEILALKWSDVSLDEGYALTRASDNKGGRDDRTPLHAVAVEHLRKIVSFGELVFPWDWSEKVLYEQFAVIQDAAGIDLPCHENHEHTPACGRYGFHDFRRAFASMNADKLSAEALQSLMRHKSYQTTQKYISYARQLNQAVEGLYVPEFLKPQTGN